MLNTDEKRPTSKSVLILGSVSAVGRAIAHQFAQNGYSLILADIEVEENERIAQDIRIRYGVFCQTLFFDASDFEIHPAFLEKVTEKICSLPEGLVICFGYMPTQEEAQKDFKLIKKAIDINYTGAVSILERVISQFEERNYGFAIVISSVAGDRGRKSNYIYGSTKGALTRYLEGLQHRLSPKNIQILIVKPGFMDTAMTYGLNLPERLIATPEEAGKIIFSAWRRKKQVVYVKWFWRYIMLIIQHLPRFIFYRTQL
ncbi:MAG TPA: SDR family oxidoreductase [Candidatus Hydrogenedens sp.]|nr:SDR family oxidoreductase [Candidatus Hydrogenedens sp.]HOK09739.1 SDR family oxidoreductase [Candidatus Hydrogenedens sp.]HOL19550.1 SDR family oxidoreductase [Candidatus Hydrogenedens sp.]HPP58215.1 SDR family oxidoreductase [Candidatus Hydrogenedens sp.]